MKPRFTSNHTTRSLVTYLPFLLVALGVAGCSSPEGEGPAPMPTTTTTSTSPPPPPPPPDFDALSQGLESPHRQDYKGGGDGGLAHITYWALKAGSPELLALSAEEQAKVKKMQQSLLHSTKLPPKDDIAGIEITGTLVVTEGAVERRQEIVLKLPETWNGALVVAGAPGTRSEFSNEGVIVPWLLRRGYAYVAGNKGMTNGGVDGNATLMSKTHPTRHWGMMMMDLGAWAKGRLEAAMHAPVSKVYAVGLSNGGYQVRRALEIDHERVQMGEKRLFAGGLDWAGAYWPDARVLDKDKDSKVTPAEFATANHLVSSNENAALTMGYAYDPGTLTTPAAFKETPPYTAAQSAMVGAGFAPESALLWGAYNITFDSLKAQLPQFKGVGYYNFTAYYFRAELMGHDLTESAPYSCFTVMDGVTPGFYTWLAAATDGGWDDAAVQHALDNANTGEFSAPLISVHGDRDGLIGLLSNGVAYRDAVEAHGKPELYRLYVIENGGHVDLHSDGLLDFDFDGTPANEGMDAKFALVQPYAERAFDYLTAWVEEGKAPPPDDQKITTDPANDALDASKISF